MSCGSKIIPQELIVVYWNGGLIGWKLLILQVLVHLTLVGDIQRPMLTDILGIINIPMLLGFMLQLSIHKTTKPKYMLMERKYQGMLYKELRQGQLRQVLPQIYISVVGQREVL
jgi:hypothetical protein